MGSALVLALALVGVTASVAFAHFTNVRRAPASWLSNATKVNDGSVRFGQNGLRCGTVGSDSMTLQVRGVTIESGNTEADYIKMRARIQWKIDGGWRTPPGGLKVKKMDLGDGYNRKEWTTPIGVFSQGNIPVRATMVRIQLKHQWWDHRIIGDDRTVARTSYRTMCYGNVDGTHDH